jgi:hypothetical protein
MLLPGTWRRQPRHAGPGGGAPWRVAATVTLALAHNYCGGTRPGSWPQREAQATVVGQCVNLSLTHTHNDYSIPDLICDLFVFYDSICEVTNRFMIYSSSVINV